MNERNQVYLPELDSVRNSDTEILEGQEALWREIVHNGHSVVLSFNQLTDSLSFLSLVKDEKTFPSILALIQKGAIKVNLFGSTRTPSQYVQESIDKCIVDIDNTFLFSGLPFKAEETDILSLLAKSLRVSDPSLLQPAGDSNAEYNKLINNNKVVVNNVVQERHPNLEMHLSETVRFVKMILAMSSAETALNPPKSKPIKMYDVISCKLPDIQCDGVDPNQYEQARTLLCQISRENSSPKGLRRCHDAYEKNRGCYYCLGAEYLCFLTGAHEKLHRIEKKAKKTKTECMPCFSYQPDKVPTESIGILAGSFLTRLDSVLRKIKGNDNLNNRSVWYQRINATSVADEIKILAKAIIDVFYNIVIETNMNGVLRHFNVDDENSRSRYFSEELSRYYNSLLASEVQESRATNGEFYVESSGSGDYSEKSEKWEKAVQLWVIWEKANTDQGGQTKEEHLYQDVSDTDRRDWIKFFKCNGIKSAINGLIRFCVYLLISLGFDQVTSCLTGHWNGWMASICLALFLFVVGDIFVAWICNRLNLGDTIQTIKTVCRNIGLYRTVKKGEYSK